MFVGASAALNEQLPSALCIGVAAVYAVAAVAPLRHAKLDVMQLRVVWMRLQHNLVCESTARLPVVLLVLSLDGSHYIKLCGTPMQNGWFSIDAYVKEDVILADNNLANGSVSCWSSMLHHHCCRS